MSNTPEAVPVPNVNLVTLSMGALLLLIEIFKSSWTSQPKEKIAAGRLTVKLEDYALTAPDACVVDPRDPAFRAANLAAVKADREWKLKTATLELPELQFRAAATALKYVLNQAGGADRFLAELQEQFRITE